MKAKDAPLDADLPSLLFELPHNAFYDEETNMVSFSLDSCTFSLTPDRFFAFVENLDDVSTVLSQMITVEEAECPTCGTHVQAMEISPIPDSDFH